MKREEIKEIVEGITKEQLDRIMEINGADIEKAKGNAATLQEQVTSLTAQLSDRDKQLKELKDEAKENEKLQSKIDALQQENATAKVEYDKKIKAIEHDHDIEGKLRDAKAKNVKAAKALLDPTNNDIDAQIKQLQENESTAFLFEQVQHTQPPKGTTPNLGGGTPPTKTNPVSLTDAVGKALNKLKG